MSTAHLMVRRSTIPGAGKGLFTKRAIVKGTLIVEYKGNITTWKAVQASELFNGYVFYINRNQVVDARRTKKALGRYANDAKGLNKIKGLRNNAVYTVKHGKVFIQATRNIPAGSEILVDYGKEYWTTVRYNKRLDARKKS
jgi:SET domain-containing protein